MKCPQCQSEDFVRHRDPVDFRAWTIRRKRCQNCRHVFLTGEIVLAGRTAEAFEMLMIGSEPMPDDSDTTT